MSTTRPGRAGTALARRREREQAILAATRKLFDDSGVRDAQIEDIAKAVGVNRAIIYRHFTGKEELFALTLVSYLDDLEARLAAASRRRRTPTSRLTALTEEFCDFGIEYPAFVDCAQTLMRRPGPELLDEVSQATLFRLGRGIAGCLRHVKDALEAGMETGEFRRADSTQLANHMYASGLGALSLARVGMVVEESSPGVPRVSAIDGEQVRADVVTAALALASAHR